MDNKILSQSQEDHILNNEEDGGDTGKTRGEAGGSGSTKEKSILKQQKNNVGKKKNNLAEKDKNKSGEKVVKFKGLGGKAF